MGGVTLSVTTRDVGHILDRILPGLIARARNLRPAFDEIGASLLTSTQMRFERQHDPDGQDWTPLAPSTAAKRGSSEPILRVNGDLYRSITHDYGHDYAEVGTNWPYARIHQLGGQAGKGHTVKIPARAYLGIDDDDEREIETILTHYILGGQW